MVPDGSIPRAPPRERSASAGGRLRRWLRIGAPYLIAAAVIAAILRRYELEDILASMASGRVAPMAAVAVGLAISLLPLAAAWDRIVMRASVPRTARPPTYADALRGKGGTAVLMALGYAFGSGGYGVWEIGRASCRERVSCCV